MGLHSQENRAETVSEGKESHSKGEAALQKKIVYQFKMRSPRGRTLHRSEEQEHRWG